MTKPIRVRIGRKVIRRALAFKYAALAVEACRARAAVTFDDLLDSARRFRAKDGWVWIKDAEIESAIVVLLSGLGSGIT